MESIVTVNFDHLAVFITKINTIECFTDLTNGKITPIPKKEKMW